MNYNEDLYLSSLLPEDVPESEDVEEEESDVIEEDEDENQDGDLLEEEETDLE